MNLFFDTETSHLPEAVSSNKSILLQLAFIVQHEDKMKILSDIMLPHDFDGIDPEQMATHHITPEVVETRTLVQNCHTFELFVKAIQKNPVLIAHNISFDINVLKREGVELEHLDKIDTLKIAKFLNDRTEMPFKSLKLEYLLYYYRLDRYNDKMFEKLNYHCVVQNHDAVYDVIKLVLVYEKLKSVLNATNDQLIELTKNPVFLKYVPFGSHKGKRFSELTYNQIEWQANNSFDEDVRFTCRKLLEDA